MDKQDIQKLRSLPIESVAERLGLRVERHRTLCPYHDDHNPSLSFSVSKNNFRCFSCGAHGDVIDLAMKVLNRNFTDTCIWLSSASVNEPISCYSCNPCSKKEFNASKYERFFRYPFLNQKASAFLFEQRKLLPSVIEWCRLSSYRDQLQIPYFDINGTLIGIQFRNLGSTGPRFWFPQGSNCHIYNLPILRHLSPSEDLYIAEGCSDCWSLMSSGHKAVAIPSATLLNAHEAEIVKGFNLHMYPDQDEAGENLFRQLSAVLNITRHSLPSDCKDYSVYYTTRLCR